MDIREFLRTIKVKILKKIRTDPDTKEIKRLRILASEGAVEDRFRKFLTPDI